MFLRAAKEHHLDLSRSYAIGDKKSDMLAAQAAGCTSILVLSGQAGEGEPDIEATPDYIARNLRQAAEFIRLREEMRR
jgi:D-glycero-D-manno-heptose 1,7-bisphosphate phosphatase